MQDLQNATRVRFDEENSQRWTSITDTYDASGTLERRAIVFDDATTRLTIFKNGRVILINQTDGFDPESANIIPDDLGEARPWFVRTTFFDDDGNLSNIDVALDNGANRFENYSEGSLQFISIDNIVNAEQGIGPYSWYSLVETFAQNGELERRDIAYIDGASRIEIFQSGILRESVFIDDTSPFGPERTADRAISRVTTTFDENGLIETRKTQFDNGVVRDMIFENGIVSSVEMRDGSDINDPGDARPWSTIFEDYDDEGFIESRHIELDDGTSKLVRFSEVITPGTNPEDAETTPLITQQIFADVGVDIDAASPPGIVGDLEPSGLRRWETQIVNYGDDGVEDGRVLRLDNGNVENFLFNDDGVLTDRLISDDNEDEDFALIHVIFNEDGSVADRIVFGDDDDIFLDLGESAQGFDLAFKTNGDISIVAGAILPVLGPGVTTSVSEDAGGITTTGDISGIAGVEVFDSVFGL